MKGLDETVTIYEKKYFTDGKKVVVCKISACVNDDRIYENFVVSGKAVCDDSDKFDEFKGKDIARAKAMCKMLKHIAQAYNKEFDRASEVMMTYGERIKKAYDLEKSYEEVIKNSLEE